MVKIKDTHSNGRNVRYGVPQDSILGPILFLLYVKEMEVIAARNGVSYPTFADDSQLYLSYNNETSDETKCSVQQCLQDIKTWTDFHFLKLNTAKTQAMDIVPRRSRTNNLDNICFDIALLWKHKNT